MTMMGTKTPMKKMEWKWHLLSRGRRPCPAGPARFGRGRSNIRVKADLEVVEAEHRH